MSRIHEPRDIAEEAMSAIVKFEQDGYMDEPRSVKDGARGTEERALTSSENKFTFLKHTAEPMSISTRPSMQRC